MSGRAITEAIMKITGLHKVDQVFYVSCTVESVDLSTRTCDCSIIDGNLTSDLPGVALMAEVDDGVLIVPTVGSTVKVLFSININPIVVQFSEIDSITIIAAGQITFDGSSFGGLVKVTDADDPDAGVLARLNKIENDLNMLKTIFTSWVPVPADGGAALHIAAANWAVEELIPTVISQLENLKVVHGN
jgi:hypothetical protein